MSMRSSHVSVQPNIDDLICAGMSSGPAEITQLNINTCVQGKVREDGVSIELKMRTLSKRRQSIHRIKNQNLTLIKYMNAC
jgi:hypothetical protein